MSKRTSPLRSAPVVVVATLAFAASSSSARAASFVGLGVLPGGSLFSQAFGVSGDGSVVVGWSDSPSGTEAFRWTQSTGMVGLGDLPGGEFQSQAFGVSGDGTVIVGESSFTFFLRKAFRWTQGAGMVDLGPLPGGVFRNTATGVSGDGSVIVGWNDAATDDEAFRWTQGTGLVGLGDLPGGIFRSAAHGVSGDGSVVVGWSDSASGIEAFRWTQGTGMVGMGDLPGGLLQSQALGVSGDGSVIVGWSVIFTPTFLNRAEAFRWTQGTGMTGLGDLLGGEFTSLAFGVSGDGSVIVGQGTSGVGNEAFIWTQSEGMLNLRDLLILRFGIDLAGWTLSSAEAVSADGTTIVGWGTNPAGDAEAWVAVITPDSGPCPGDANGDSLVNFADITSVLGNWLVPCP